MKFAMKCAMEFVKPRRALLVLALLAGVTLAGSPALAADGGLRGCWVTDWPDHPRDDLEIKAVFDVRPDRGSVRLVLSGNGGSRTVHPNDVDFEHGVWEYEFDDIYLAPGTWTPTLHWSVNGAAHSATQESFTIR